MRNLIFVAVLLVAIPCQSGCVDYFASGDDYPDDILIKPDGTVVFSTSHGNIFATSDQGASWERLTTLDQLASGRSAFLDDLAIESDGTIWGIYSARSGPNYLSFPMSSYIAVSCDEGETFETIGPEGVEFDDGFVFVERDSTIPLVLSSAGQLYEPSTIHGCPDAIHPLGTPNPVGSYGSAAVCGEVIYQSVSSRVFRSADRGHSWELDWDFYKGGAQLVCKGDEIWAYGAWWVDETRDDRVAKRNYDTGQWVELGRFGVQSHRRILLYSGVLFAVGTNESNELKILAMSADGDIQEFPNPPLNSDEYLEDFEIAPDGVFWVATPSGVYRDDITEVYTKVWP